jgi:hypothetical protein
MLDIMSLRQYMQLVRDNLGNDTVLKSFGYEADDKDMGYRSGLRYLGIAQSSVTDDIAQEMIYGQSTRRKVKEQECPQLFLNLV